jgi:PAS domain S-box-containing protein
MTSYANDILLIDDVPGHAQALREALLGVGYDPANLEWARTLTSGLERLAHKNAWAIFLNLFLPDSWGIDTLDRLFSVTPATPVVVLSGADDEPLCKTAVAHGAQGYVLESSPDICSFALGIRSSIEHEMARQELFSTNDGASIMLHAIGDAVAGTDISGHITYLNAAAENMTGWSMQEASGQPLAEVFQIIDGLTRLPAADRTQLAIQQDPAGALSSSCILVRRDGCESAIENSTAAIHDGDGRVTGAVIVFHQANLARPKVLEMLRWATPLSSQLKSKTNIR